MTTADLLHLSITTNAVPGRRRRPPTEAALLFRSVVPFEHRHLNLLRKTYQMASYPIKQIVLGLVGCKVSDQGAFSGISPELFDLCLIVLHRQRPCPCCDEFRRAKQAESIYIVP